MRKTPGDGRCAWPRCRQPGDEIRFHGLDLCARCWARLTDLGLAEFKRVLDVSPATTDPTTDRR